MILNTAKESRTWKKELAGIQYGRMTEVISVSFDKWWARKVKRLLLHDREGDDKE